MPWLTQDEEYGRAKYGKPNWGTPGTAIYKAAEPMPIPVPPKKVLVGEKDLFKKLGRVLKMPKFKRIVQLIIHTESHNKSVQRSHIKYMTTEGSSIMVLDCYYRE